MLSGAGLLYCIRRNFPETSIPSLFQSGEVPRITPSFTVFCHAASTLAHLILLSTQFPGFLTIKSNIFKTALLQWVKDIQFDDIWRNKILILMFYFNICSKQDNNAVWILFFPPSFCVCLFLSSQGKMKTFSLILYVLFW